MRSLRGLDTNVLLRALTGDDSKQSPVARNLFEEAERQGRRLHLSTPVLCELVWALRGGRYRYDRPTLVVVLERLFQTSLFEIQHRDAARLALEDFREGPGDFADYLIGRLNQAVGCESTLTFDADLKAADSFELLTG